MKKIGRKTSIGTGDTSSKPQTMDLRHLPEAGSTENISVGKDSRNRLQGDIRLASPGKAALNVAADSFEKSVPETSVFSGYRAEIELIIDGNIVGWAYDSEPKTKASVFYLFIDGLKAGPLIIDELRPDIGETPGEGEVCGFSFPIPIEFYDGLSHQFAVSAEGDSLKPICSKLVQVPKARPIRTKPVKGVVDRRVGLYVIGWALDPEKPDRSVIVELLADGVSVSEGTASIYRVDLLNAGLGDGNCAFKLRIPNTLFDSRPHALAVREKNTGTILPGNEISFGGDSEAHAVIEGQEGTALCGWLNEPSVFNLAGEIEVWVDGEIAGRGYADQYRSEVEGSGFRVEIDRKFLDGRPHEVALMSPEGVLYAATFLELQAALTPFSALQRYAGTSYLKSYLSLLGPRRYESLRRNYGVLSSLLNNKETRPTLDIQAIANIAHYHDALIRGYLVPVGECGPIALMREKNPKVSIVVPVHNKFTMTHTCLASIAAALNIASYEVIVVDDGSTDETTTLESLIQNVTVVRNKTALGFVGACNAGLALARGEYTVMLNNDTEVFAGWLDDLLDPFQRFDRVGMTGAKLIYPNGVLQEAGGIVWGDGQPWNVGRNGNASDPRYNYTRQVDYLSGACVMLPTPLFKEIGGFNTFFAPAYYEDTDLAFAVRDKGFKTIYTPFCEVVHYEGVSNGTSTSGEGLKRFQAINEPKFKGKWVAAYRHNGVVGRDDPLMVQDRNVLLRALVFDAQTLTPDLDAGSYSAMQEIRIMQSLGFKVTFVPANLAYMGGYTEELQRMGVEVVYAPFVTSLDVLIRHRAQEFDLFYVARYGVAREVLNTIREVRPDARVVLNIHDLHFLRQMREALLDQSQEKLEEARSTRDEELAVLRQVDVAISYSEVEQAVIQSHNFEATKTAACPWVVEVLDEVPPFEARRDIAFLGGFGHTPNVVAVRWFASEVMPLLRKKFPGIRFLVYGSKMPEDFKVLEADDVILKGYVKNTDEVYDQTRLFVSPLLTGAGLKGKVIGALARGAVSVLTPTAAEGTGVRNGLEGVIAETPEAWASAIAELYSSQTQWEKMSTAAQALAEERYSFAKGRETLRYALGLAGVYASAGDDASTLCSKKRVG
jgi:GT2 family glycosyltransferase